MKKILTILALLISTYVSALNYYVDAVSGNDSQTGTSALQAFKTLAKAQSVLVNGDNLYIKAGTKVYGSLRLLKKNNITISTYGGSTRALISGYTILGGWVDMGGGIYRSSIVNLPNKLNLLTIDDVPQQIGTYPDNGYLTYESFNGRTDITDNQLTAATNWTGAEIVIKKEGYILERDLITGHIGNTLTYVPQASINPRNGVSPSTVSAIPNKAGFGYKIQRDPRTLTKFGEWYPDPAAKVVQVYFGSNNPANYVVKIPTIDTLIDLGTNSNASSNISIINVDFEGANTFAIFIADGSNLIVRNSNIEGSGAKGISVWNTPNTLVDTVSVNNVMCGGIDISGRYAAGVTVSNSTVRNVALFPGMGSFWDDMDMVPIGVIVSNTALIEKNRIDSGGYIGIRFQGNNITIQKNYSTHLGRVKDDGGHIYTYSDSGATGRVVRNNIGINDASDATGAAQGNALPAHFEFYYNDGNPGAGGVEVYNNVGAGNSNRGIYLNDPTRLNVHDNLLWNNGLIPTEGGNGNGGWGIQKHQNGVVHDLRITNNTVISLNNNQGIGTFYTDAFGSGYPVASTLNQTLSLIGVINNNTYYATNDTIFFTPSINTFNGPTARRNFATWKSTTSQDLASVLRRTPRQDSIRLVINPTSSPLTIPLEANYTGTDGTFYSGSITLAANTGAAIILTSNFTSSYSLVTSASTGGTISKSPDSLTYIFGTNVTLTATSNTGYTFINWSGDTTSGNTTLVVPIYKNRNINANFQINTYTLTKVATNGSITGATSYTYGSTATITAVPALGYTFTGWSGAASGTNPTVSILIDGNKTVTANFAPQLFSLVFTTTPSVGGLVTATPSQSNYSYNSNVVMNASANTGYSFYRWTGDTVISNASITVPLYKNRNLVANFQINSYIISTLATNGTITGGGSYTYGSTATLTATPNPGYTFVNWSGSASGTSSTTTVLVDGNKTVSAVFQLIPVASYTLTTNISPSLGGTVSKSPDSVGYNSSTVTLTATAQKGYTFSGWTGSVVSASNPVTVVMNGNKVVTANFTADPVPPAQTIRIRLFKKLKNKS